MKDTNTKTWLNTVFDGEKYTLNQLALFFFFLGLALYINTSLNEFNIDDYLVTHVNEFVKKGISGIPDILTSPYLNDDKVVGDFRPLSQITFAIEYQLFEENPKISHCINAVLYGICCLLIFKLFTQLFEKTYLKFILVGVLIFTVHPIHTEVVASLKNRENLLNAIFGVLACVQFLKFLTKKQLKYFIFSLIFLLLAISSKVEGVVFIGIIPLIAYFKSARPRYILFYLVVAVILFVCFNLYINSIIPNQFRNTEFYETPLIGENNTFANTFKLSFISLGYYIKLLVFPFPLRYYYGTGLINIPSWNNPFLWISLVFHIVLLILGLKGLKQRKFYSFNILWYLGSIFLFSQFIEPVTGIIAERHVFIASIGFSLIIGFCIIKLYEFIASKNAFFALILKFTGIGIILLFMTCVIARNKDWYDAITLIEADKPHLEASIFSHYLSGNQYIREANDVTDTISYRNNINLSIIEYRKVLNKIPTHTSTWYNMGLAYIRIGDFSNAYQAFFKAHEINHSFRSVNYLVGFSAVKLGDTLSAVVSFENELNLRPNNGNAIEQLYIIKSNQKKYKEIIDLCLELEAKGIQNEKLYKSLANAYYFFGDEKKALYYRRKVETRDYKENDNSSI